MVTEDDECIHGLGPVSACTICNGKARLESSAQWQVFDSRFDFICPVCHALVRAGDSIAWRDGERARHEDCS